MIAISHQKHISALPVPSVLPFTVDTWTADARVHNKLQFVTHGHKDHLAGIEQHAHHICCSPLTLELLCIKFPGLAARLDACDVVATTVEDWDMLELRAGEEQGGYAYSVASIPLADHCPGAVMFLFQSSVWGSLLHTGDCSFTAHTLPALQETLEGLVDSGGRLDTLYMDATGEGYPHLGRAWGGQGETWEKKAGLKRDGFWL